MPVLEQDGLGLAAQRRDARPGRVGVDEGHVAGEIRAAVVAAQDRPFDQLLRDRIGDRVLRLVRLGAAAAAQMIERALGQRDVDRRGGHRRGERWRARRSQRSAGAAAARSRCGRSRGCRLRQQRARREAVWPPRQAWRARSWLLSWPPSTWPAFGLAADFLSALFVSALGLSDFLLGFGGLLRRRLVGGLAATGVAWLTACCGSGQREQARDRERTQRLRPVPRCHAALPDQAARIEIRSQYLFR